MHGLVIDPLSAVARPEIAALQSVPSTVLKTETSDYLIELHDGARHLCARSRVIVQSFPDDPPAGDMPCIVCRMDSPDDDGIICDGCDAVFHFACTTPPMMEVPVGDWFCEICAPQRLAKTLETEIKQKALVAKNAVAMHEEGTIVVSTKKILLRGRGSVVVADPVATFAVMVTAEKKTQLCGMLRRLLGQLSRSGHQWPPLVFSPFHTYTNHPNSQVINIPNPSQLQEFSDVELENMSMAEFARRNARSMRTQVAQLLVHRSPFLFSFSMVFQLICILGISFSPLCPL